jgi:hypothetical protein
MELTVWPFAPRFGRVGQVLGWVELSGAALFAVFVKGAGFSSMRNSQRAKKERSGIGRWEKRIEDKKTRTLEHHKGAAPKVQNRSKAGAPGIQYRT